MDPSEPQRRLSLGRKAFIGLLLALMLLGGLEAIARVSLPTLRKATLPQAMVENHTQATGFRYDPDLLWYWRNLPSPASQINEYGFRRTEPMEPQAPEGILRGVTLGDSQTLGAGVEASQSYSAVAEAELGDGWEVLNAGISGYRSLNIYRLLQRRVAYFEPDFIVVDCAAGDSPRDDGPLAEVPLRGGAGRLFGLIWDSALFRTIELMRGRLLAPEVETKSLEDRGLPPEWQPGSHDLIKEWAEKNDVKLIFMAYPVVDEPTGELRCLAPESKLPEGVPYLDACALFKATGAPPSAHFLDSNHMTVRGNEVIGRGLAALLRDLYSKGDR